jgi:hypothetical protein
MKLGPIKYGAFTEYFGVCRIRDLPLESTHVTTDPDSFMTAGGSMACPHHRRRFHRFRMPAVPLRNLQHRKRCACNSETFRRALACVLMRAHARA